MGITKVPFEYIHPKRKKEAGDAGALSKEDSSKKLSNKSDARAAPANADETVSVRLIAYFPCPGVSDDFDAMIEGGVSHKLATLAFLKRSTAFFEAQISTNDLIIEAPSYPCETEYVETIRMIRRSTFEWAKKQYDPHTILSARALGTRLGTAILAHYFASKNVN